MIATKGAEMYKHILIATDGSELAAKGLAHGGQLAKHVGAKVTIVTVTEPWSALEMATLAHSGHSDIIQDFEKAAREQATRILDAAVKALEGAGVEVDTVHIADSHPAEGILRAAKEKGCDLIVMASHGRRGIRRLVLGSQTTEVVAHSEIPVLVIR